MAAVHQREGAAMKKIHHGIKHALSAFFLWLPGVSFARGSQVNFEGILQNIVDYLTGEIAHWTIVLALVGAGYLYLGANRIQKETFIKIVVAAGIIFGAPALYDTLVG